jgi:hypothetical protein
MIEQFTLEELQTFMILLNSTPTLLWMTIEKRDSLAQKVERLIAKKQEIPAIEHRDYSGIPATVEHLKG